MILFSEVGGVVHPRQGLHPDLHAHTGVCMTFITSLQRRGALGDWLCPAIAAGIRTGSACLVHRLQSVLRIALKVALSMHATATLRAMACGESMWLKRD